jgi:hypothetical protein
MTLGADTGHLDETVRPSLRLPDERRIAMIDRDRWIGYGRAQDAISELERILRSERRQRPDNLLIEGGAASRDIQNRTQQTGTCRAGGDPRGRTSQVATSTGAGLT